MAAVCCTNKNPEPYEYRVGFAYPDELSFNEDTATGDPIDISADDFKLVIKDSTGTVIDTLTLGDVSTDGLEYVAPNKLKQLIGSPTTDTAGTYTADLIITEPDGGHYPLFTRKIIVKP